MQYNRNVNLPQVNVSHSNRNAEFWPHSCVTSGSFFAFILTFYVACWLWITSLKALLTSQHHYHTSSLHVSSSMFFCGRSWLHIWHPRLCPLASELSMYSIWYLVLFKFREGNASAKCFMTYLCLWSFWIIYCENLYVRIICPGDSTPGNSHFLQRPRRKLMVA